MAYSSISHSIASAMCGPCSHSEQISLFLRQRWFLPLLHLVLTFKKNKFCDWNGCWMASGTFPRMLETSTAVFVLGRLCV